MQYVQLCLFDYDELLDCSNNLYHKTNVSYKLYAYLYIHNPSNSFLGDSFSHCFRRLCAYISGSVSVGYSDSERHLFNISQVSTYLGRISLFPL